MISLVSILSSIIFSILVWSTIRISWNCYGSNILIIESVLWNWFFTAINNDLRIKAFMMQEWFNTLRKNLCRFFNVIISSHWIILHIINNINMKLSFHEMLTAIKSLLRRVGRLEMINDIILLRYLKKSKLHLEQILYR